MRCQNCDYPNMEHYDKNKWRCPRCGFTIEYNVRLGKYKILDIGRGERPTTTKTPLMGGSPDYWRRK